MIGDQCCIHVHSVLLAFFRGWGLGGAPFFSCDVPFQAFHLTIVEVSFGSSVERDLAEAISIEARAGLHVASRTSITAKQSS